MKTSDIHVAVFPIGTAVRTRKSQCSRADGTAEYYKLLWVLCRQKAISRVTLLQKSDWKKATDREKLELDPRGILYDFYSENPTIRMPDRKDSKGQSTAQGITPEEVHYMWDVMKDLGPLPDFGIGFPSQGFIGVNIPGFVPRVDDPSKLAASMVMAVRYSAPIVHYLNVSGIPWYKITTDPKYHRTTVPARDICNLPKAILSQYDDATKWNTISHYGPGAPRVVTPARIEYSGIEKLNLVDEEVISPRNERPNRFSVVAMQSSYGKDKLDEDYRYLVLKEWVFNQDPECQTAVYGKWSEGFYDAHPQFKGLVPPDEIDRIFRETRYTLVIPIRKHWVTSKYAEMLRVGVVPFIHPDYDTQHHVIPADHPIRVKSPEDLRKKMDFLDANPEKRVALVEKLQSQLIGDARDGKFLIDIINRYNERCGVPVRIDHEIDATPVRKIQDEMPQARALF